MWEWGGEIGFEIGLGELNRDDSRERERWERWQEDSSKEKRSYARREGCIKKSETI